MRKGGKSAGSLRIGRMQLAVDIGGDRDRRVPVALGCAAALAGALLVPGTVNAETVNGVVTIAEPAAGVRSIGVSSTSVVLSECYDNGGDTTVGLALPNGICGTLAADAVAVTYNSTDGSPGHVHVSGGAATGDAGGQWTLTDVVPPGSDLYNATVRRINVATGQFSGGAMRLNGTAACDAAWSAEADPCAATAGQSVAHRLAIRGPDSTGNSDSTWTIPYVFTAVA